MTSSKGGGSKQGRDAKNGQYVSQAEVRRRPSTTVNETRKSSGKKK